jgi:hypothetical protein
MAKDQRRVDIGFQGGQVLPAKVTEDDYNALRKALEDGRSERWHVLKTVDYEVAIDLAQVVYVRLDNEDQRVGF